MDMHGSLPFSKAFDLASGAIGDRFMNPFWKLKEFLFGAPLRHAVGEVKEFGQTIVADSVSKRGAGSLVESTVTRDTTDPLQTNLINALLDNLDNHQVVADAAMNFLSAGKSSRSGQYSILRSPSLYANHLSLIISFTFHRKRYNRSISHLGFLPPFTSSVYCSYYPIRTPHLTLSISPFPSAHL